jgi:cobalt-zinc-cadmium efflux system protein
MMGVAIGGLVVNLGCLWLLYGGRNENLNVRGAWLHVMGDTLGSVGAITAAVLIAAFGWIWADPVASALIALLIVRSAWCLLKDAIAILMEGTPPGVDTEKVRDALMETSGVVDVHHLHIWSIGSGRNTLSAHVVTREFGRHRLLLTELQRMIHERFHIAHSTIQIEPEHHEDPPSQF